MELDNKFSSMLKQALKQKGITQTELARSIRVKPNTISNYCKGVSQPDVDVIIKIASYLDMPIDYLLTGKRYENKNAREELGLSEQSLQILKELNQLVWGDNFYGLSSYIDRLIADEDFRKTFFEAFCEYQAAAKVYPQVKKILEGEGKNTTLNSYMNFVEYEAANKMFMFFMRFFERDNIARDWYNEESPHEPIR